MVGRYGMDSSGLGYVPVVGACEHGSIKGGEFLEYPPDYSLLKEDVGPWSWLVKGSNPPSNI
jgi:hypothetical protein